MNRYFFLSFICVVMSSMFSNADLVMLEDFEDNTVLYTGVTEFFDTGNDHFTIVPLNGTPSHDDGSHTGFSGNYFSAEDINDPQGPGLATQTLTFDIDVTNFESLTFGGLFGAGNNSGTGDIVRYDGTGAIGPDFVVVTAQIDTGPVQQLLAFAGVGTNGLLLEDTDFDGTGDGTALGLAATAFSNLAIAGTGSNLQLLIQISMDASGEEFAMDSIRIDGTPVAVPEPSGFLAFGVLGLVLSGVRWANRLRLG